MKLFPLWLALVLLTFCPATHAAEVIQSDLCIYGGTAAGVIAAVQAKKMGKSVVIVSPDKHLGGLSSGGLGWTDTGNKEVIGGGVLATATNCNAILCQLVPWEFDPAKQRNLKRTFMRASVAVNRLLANLGVQSATPLLERFGKPMAAGTTERRWLEGFYLDQPEEWDDPYRFFRW